MEAFFKRIDSQRFPSDDVVLKSHSLVIQGYKKVGLVEKAQQVMDELLEKGVSPDVKLFSCLMAVYGNAGLPERAEEIFRVSILFY